MQFLVMYVDVGNTVGVIQINEEFVNKDQFLIGDVWVGEARHLVFATPEQLALLKTARRWFMDGTFKITDGPYRHGQLFGIHAFLRKGEVMKQVPLVFVLMPRKRKEDYVAVLRVVVEKLGGCDVEGFMLDFEAAAWQAIRSVFPGKEISGCFFHWSQALWKKVQGEGLSTVYHDKDRIHRYIRKLFALPFLPANSITATFAELEAMANTDPLREVVRYIRDTWIESTVFPPRTWCVYGQSVRTNNDCEGWHYRLNHAAGHHALVFYRLVPLLQREAKLVEYQSRAVQDEQPGIRERRKVYERMETAIQQQWVKFRQGDITTAQLLKGCSRVYSPV